MIYATEEELALLTPQVSVPTSTVKKRGYLYAASVAIDGAIGRPKYGLEIRTIRNEQIPLDLNFNGILQHTPHLDWADTTGQVIIPGQGTNQTVTLSDFDVEYESGVIRYKKILTGGAWPRQFGSTSGSWHETISPYHSGSLNTIDGNELPYRLTASYKAGFFTIQAIAGSGSPSGSDSVQVTDVTDLSIGDNFYFSADPVNQSDVSQRLITAINTTTGVVSFTPSVNYALTTSMSLRKIDLAVRMALGLIIADMITFPPNTFRFNKGLGRSALVKQWERATKRSIPPAAMELLVDYLR